jgi:hypothetical protein
VEKGGKMITRSQNRKTLYEVNIDFDEASQAWKANKKSIGNGSYKYICLRITKQGKPCKRESCPECDHCKIHRP